MALRVPIFKQILGSIGVVDASRQTARKSLENYPYTIGISTGGVAEVFETNGDDECIILKERIGLIKLAIRTGADLVPCYRKFMPNPPPSPSLIVSHPHTYPNLLRSFWQHQALVVLGR
jgi:hypothetical protein